MHPTCSDLKQIVINGYNGFVVPTNSPLEIAEKLNDVLHDTEQWKKMSENALTTIYKKFNMKQSESKLHDLYHGMVDDFELAPF